MPIVQKSNNRVLPPNSRTVDVAKSAIDELVPSQQRKMMNAFMVQGYSGILYNHLLQGKKCSCQSSQKTLNTKLGIDGKASVGRISELITGIDSFGTDKYGSNNWNSNSNSESDFDSVFSDLNVTSPFAPKNKHQGIFDVAMGANKPYPAGHEVEGKYVGDNGPLDTFLDIDKLVGDFDASTLGFSDVSCAICFGSGFIGGYSPFGTQRQVVTVDSVDFMDGNINFDDKPWSANCTNFNCLITLPKNPEGLDTFRLMNGIVTLNAVFTIDSVLVDSPYTLLKFCNGMPHLINVQLVNSETWTHLEIQFNVSKESAYFEFPKLKKGLDISKIDTTEPFNIILSPNIPSLRPLDIIVESTFGKCLVVQNSDWWNTRNRQVLGWECTVRVIQPQELYRILPTRGRVLTKNVTTNLVRTNVSTSRGVY